MSQRADPGHALTSAALAKTQPQTKKQPWSHPRIWCSLETEPSAEHAEFRLFQAALVPSAGNRIPNVEFTVGQRWTHRLQQSRSLTFRYRYRPYPTRPRGSEMGRLLLTGVALVALGTVPVGGGQKSVAVADTYVAGAYETRAEQQIKIRCTRRGCRTLRPGCRTVRKVTRGSHVVCSRQR